MQLYDNYICPVHTHQLNLSNEKDMLTCPKGCIFPIKNHIPRFVTGENYASAFGLQWKTYQRTQLDSYTGISISKERLQRIVGRSLDIFRNKTVLEAGCGAGRFTEIMLQSGANVLAVDLSDAVEANYLTCSDFEKYSVCQADILNLPVLPNQFDIVICIGVIQHTPDPEKTISALCSYLKPGGLLLVDHYTQGYPTTPVRNFCRFFLKRMNIQFSLRFVQSLTGFLWPIHIFFNKYKGTHGFRQIRPFFLYLSPVIDYQDSYPLIGDKLLREWAILDTHDTLTDYYKHLRSPEEISEHLSRSGMIDIDIYYGGNGIEARAIKSV